MVASGSHSACEWLERTPVVLVVMLFLSALRGESVDDPLSCELMRGETDKRQNTEYAS